MTNDDLMILRRIADDALDAMTAAMNAALYNDDLHDAARRAECAYHDAMHDLTCALTYVDDNA